MLRITPSHLLLSLLWAHQLSLPLAHAIRTAASEPYSHCRCTYGEACWPSPADFAQLAAQVSQPLVHPVPPASPCYASPYSSECADVRQGWLDGFWRADQPGAMQQPNFEAFTFANDTIEACYLDTTLGVPCGQGSVPVVGVDARSVGDVQAAVRFAAEHNLRFVVRNTGHDFLGRSDGRGSFVVWTHHLKNITVHPTFTPEGGQESYEYAITLGAGEQWQDAHEAANASSRILVGGVGSVGAAGGWLLGGGHSQLSPTYGLGVDNVIEFHVVISNGTYLTANAHQYPDLFWALRGGGGGTFGVVTSLTYRTHPAVPVIEVNFASFVNATRPNAALSQAFTELVRITPHLTDLGWGGYTQILPTADPAPGLAYTFFYIIPNATWAEANATIDPYLTFVKEVAANSTRSGDPADELLVQKAVTTPYPSWFAWYTALTGRGPQEVGRREEIGSWLIPRDVVDAAPENVAQTILGYLPESPYPGSTWYLVAGGAVSKADPESTGLHPAWRKASVHSVVGTTWPEGTSAETIEAQRVGLRAMTASLRALAPDAGAYFNEAALFEPDPAASFFGSHYDRLRAIKKVYDPIDLFVVTEGVGSSEWDKELKCRV